jgi:hypothetical protein
MRLSAFVTLAVLPAAMLALPAGAQPPQRVRVVIPTHLPQSTDVATVYAATCQTVPYKLTVTPAQKTVILSTGGPDVDLSDTSVGARLLEQDVLVKVGFNCPHDAINIFLSGVKLVDLAMPTGFRDGVSVRANGDVGKTMPMVVPVDEMATPRTAP